jgi:hypothetical protein
MMLHQRYRLRNFTDAFVAKMQSFIEEFHFSISVLDDAQKIVDDFSTPRAFFS